MQVGPLFLNDNSSNNLHDSPPLCYFLIMNFYIKVFFAWLAVLSLSFAYFKFLAERFTSPDFVYAFLYAFFIALFSTGYLFFRIKPTRYIYIFSFLGNYITGHIFIFYFSEIRYSSPSFPRLIGEGIITVFNPYAVMMGGIFTLPIALLFTCIIGRLFRKDFI